MAASRHGWLCLLSVTLTLAIVQPGFSQSDAPRSERVRGGLWSQVPLPLPTSRCEFYSLADLGDDPNLDLWIADTIPQMIEPGSWKTADGKSKLSYYAPGKVLVINQTPAVHAKVSAFLNDLKQSLAKTSARIDPQVRPVQFTAPVSNAARPKHLFHFIIRNESDGGGDPSLSWLGRLPLPVFVNQYSSDPMARMENMLIESENLRQIHEEWRRFWMNDQPSHLTPYRIHGGVGPASSPISAPPCPPVTGGSPPRSAAPPTIIAQ